MDPLIAMPIAWSITLCLAVLAAATLRHPLRMLLLELCGTEQRACFWTIWSTSVIVLVPMMAVSAIEPGPDAGRFIQDVVFYALCGIALALLGMGRAVWSRTPHDLRHGAE